MNNDNLANVLSAIDNAEKVGRPQVVATRSGGVVTRVLEVMKTSGYVESYSIEEDGRGGKLTVKLQKAINRVGAIKPRFSVKADNFVKFEKRYLPAQGFGMLIVSTPQGIMTHTQAKEKNAGGKLLAYCY